MCNAYLQQRADAYRVLQDLASVFRGMAYWASGAAVAVAGMPRDPVYTYTAANVVDGRFTYTGAGLRLRYTVALVSWNDPSDMGRAKIEVVEAAMASPATACARSRSRPLRHCSSQGRAQRMGKWLLLTSRMGRAMCRFRWDSMAPLQPLVRSSAWPTPPGRPAHRRAHRTAGNEGHR